MFADAVAAGLLLATMSVLQSAAPVAAVDSKCFVVFLASHFRGTSKQYCVHSNPGCVNTDGADWNDAISSVITDGQNVRAFEHVSKSLVTKKSIFSFTLGLLG